MFDDIVVAQHARRGRPTSQQLPTGVATHLLYGCSHTNHLGVELVGLACWRAAWAPGRVQVLPQWRCASHQRGSCVLQAVHTLYRWSDRYAMHKPAMGTNQTLLKWKSHAAYFRRQYICSKQAPRRSTFIYGAQSEVWRRSDKPTARFKGPQLCMPSGTPTHLLCAIIT